MPLTFIGRSKNKIAVPTVTNERQQYASGRLACQKCTRRRRRRERVGQEVGETAEEGSNSRSGSVNVAVFLNKLERLNEID